MLQKAVSKSTNTKKDEQGRAFVPTGDLWWAAFASTLIPVSLLLKDAAHGATNIRLPAKPGPDRAGSEVFRAEQSDAEIDADAEARGGQLVGNPAA